MKLWKVLLVVALLALLATTLVSAEEGSKGGKGGKSQRRSRRISARKFTWGIFRWRKLYRRLVESKVDYRQRLWERKLSGKMNHVFVKLCRSIQYRRVLQWRVQLRKWRKLARSRRRNYKIHRHWNKRHYERLDDYINKGPRVARTDKKSGHTQVRDCFKDKHPKNIYVCMKAWSDSYKSKHIARIFERWAAARRHYARANDAEHHSEHNKLVAAAKERLKEARNKIKAIRARLAAAIARRHKAVNWCKRHAVKMHKPFNEAVAETLSRIDKFSKKMAALKEAIKKRHASRQVYYFTYCRRKGGRSHEVRCYTSHRRGSRRYKFTSCGRDKEADKDHKKAYTCTH